MPRIAASSFNRSPHFSLSDVLPIFDFVAVLLAAYASTIFCSLTAASEVLASSYIAPQSIFHAWSDRGNMALIGASLATYLLYDQNLTSLARQRKTRALVVSVGLRALAVIAMIVLVGYATALFDNLSQSWLLAWLVGGVLLIAPSRLMVARRSRRSGNTENDLSQNLDSRIQLQLQRAAQYRASQVRPTPARDAAPLYPCAKEVN